MTDQEFIALERLLKKLDTIGKEIDRLKVVNGELLTALTAALIHIEEFDTRSHYPFSTYTRSYTNVTNGARQAIAKAGKASP